MSVVLLSLVKQRLTAAAEDIFVLFERTIAEYEEELSRSKQENERHRKLLDAVLQPQLQIHRADVQQLVVVKEEQQEWSSSLDQEDPKPPPHIKEEQEEHWSSQEGEQLQGLEEADITKSTFTSVSVKSEDDEKPQSSQLHQRQTEHLETEADGEDCGGPEPARSSDPERHLQPETEDNPGDSSEPETGDSSERDTEDSFEPDTEDSGDWTETREPGSNSQRNKQDPVSDSGRSAGEKTFGCSVCKKSFKQSSHLKEHIRIHTGEKPFSCSVCKKSFKNGGHLKGHMKIHTGEKSFSCSVCKKSFAQRSDLKGHIRIHTGEKPFSCSVCDKRFTHSYQVKRHKCVGSRRSAGVKPFSCSVCEKSFAQRGNLKAHMRFHTGEKPFSCSVCDKRFTHSYQVKRHKCVGRQSSQLHQTQTEENREAEPPASSSAEHMETEADGEDCGGPEPARNSHLERNVQPETEDNTGDSSETDTGDREGEEFWKQSSESLSDLSFLTFFHSGETFNSHHQGEELFTEGGYQNQHIPNQEDPEPPPHIKEEQEELWNSQEGEQLQGLEEADTTKSTFTPVSVKSVDDEEKPQSSQLHQRQTEHLETEADVEDCGGPEPARNSDPERHSQTQTEDNPGDSSEPDIEDSGDWKETREPGSNSQRNKKDPVSDSGRSAGEKTFCCSVCKKSFKQSSHLKEHIRIHTGEKPFSCSVCKKSFKNGGHLKGHMRIHTGEKPFSCSVCKKYFTQGGYLKGHMRIHTGEKPFSCSLCNRSFAQRVALKGHMRIHTGEKPFSCSACKKSFAQKSALKGHIRIHTGEKPFSCSVCGKRFTRSHQVKRHKCVGHQSSQFHQTQSEENREAEPPASSSAEHMDAEADGEDCGGPEPARN